MAGLLEPGHLLVFDDGVVTLTTVGASAPSYSRTPRYVDAGSSPDQATSNDVGCCSDHRHRVGGDGEVARRGGLGYDVPKSKS